MYKSRKKAIKKPKNWGFIATFRVNDLCVFVLKSRISVLKYKGNERLFRWQEES